MASFNKPKKAAVAAPVRALAPQARKIATARPDTVNKAGGKAFQLTAHYEYVFALLTTFLEPEFYSTPSQKIQQIREAMLKVNDPVFAAKAAIYARTVYGMRSVTHLIAADIAKSVKGQKFTKNFFDKVVYRVDDASEILAAYLTMYGKPVPNSLKKGLALALSKFSEHQLAKYKGGNKNVKLVDLFNLVHPKPNAENAKAYKDLIEGKLASTDTWESELSAAGQMEGDKIENKREVWAKLISTKKIGYFALLRNLRNILDQADTATIDQACKLLVDEKLIQKSLVLPFRYMTAQAELAKLQSNPSTRKVMTAVSKAIDISLQNVPEFDGETLVVLDDSASMFGSGYSFDAANTKSPAMIGSLFASVLAKKNNADLMLFNSDARYATYRTADPVSTICDDLRSQFKSGGTNFHSIFQKANQKYDRIIILSDMQGWMGGNCPSAAFAAYCTKYKANPKIYSFDLQGHGTLQFPQNGVYCLAGFSEKTMDLMKVLEEDPAGLISAVNQIEL